MPSATGPSVVSYRNSTSNHNAGDGYPIASIVVSYRNSTSNHNSTIPQLAIASLYLIEILHQTTTALRTRALLLCCILSKFYIKPQQLPKNLVVRRVVSYRNSTSNHNDYFNPIYNDIVVSYRNSTSNHNTGLITGALGQLYLIEILHQTTTTEAATTSDS